MWMLTAPLANLPLNDDWVYALAVRKILETGQFSLPSPASANVIAQAYWGALFCLPFGFSFTALRLSTFVLGGIGVVSCFQLLRELRVRPGVASVGALTLAANPIYLELSTTFMTDVPFVALTVASLWLHIRGVQRRSALAACAALILSVASILIRQFGLALPLAFAAGHLMRKPLSPRRLAEAGLLVGAPIIIDLGYPHWIMATGRTTVMPLALHSLLSARSVHAGGDLLANGMAALPYLGLFTAPVLACLCRDMRPWTERSPRAILIGALSAFILLAILAKSAMLLPSFGNILTEAGLGPLTLLDTETLGLHRTAISLGVKALWVLATAIGCVAMSAFLLTVLTLLPRLLAAMHSPAARSAIWIQSVLAVFACAYFGGMLLLGLKATLFDRYFLPLIVPMSAFFVVCHAPATGPSRSGAVLAGPLLTVFTLFAVAGTHDYQAWNAARWRAIVALMKAGVSPQHIDGGYEFNGWLGLKDVDHYLKGSSPDWWTQDKQYLITEGPMEGYGEASRVPFRRWLGIGPDTVIVLRRDAQGGRERKTGD